MSAAGMCVSECALDEASRTPDKEPDDRQSAHEYDEKDQNHKQMRHKAILVSRAGACRGGRGKEASWRDLNTSRLPLI